VLGDLDPLPTLSAEVTTFGESVRKVYPPPESLRPTIYGERYVVSAGHPLVADVANQVFAAGGNAIDAGVAAGLASAVVQPDMCNLGGVAPILIRAAGSDQVSSVAGVGWWGAEATLEAYRARYGDEMPVGPGVGLVPAAVSAYVRSLKAFGTWGFADCAAPAIALATDGFVLDQRLAESLTLMGSEFDRWPDTAAIYWPHGRGPVAGDRLVQTALGRTLQRLADAEHGAGSRGAGLDAVHDAFYRGEIAATIARFSQEHGGWLTVDDLAGFEAEIEPALMRRFRHWEVWTPTTWCQGAALLQTLGILEPEPLEGLGHNSAEYVHLIVEALKLTFADREQFYGDPRFVDVPIEWLISTEHCQELRVQIDPETVGPGVEGIPGASSGRLDTTYLCTIDAEGNVFSATPSDTIDGGPIIPELGLLISQRGLQSRTDPAHPACLAPGKRPRITPSPAIALGQRAPETSDREVLAFGCPGGDVILQAMLQGFLNVSVFGMTAQQAIEAPRFIASDWPDSFYPHLKPPPTLSLEGRFEDSVPLELARIGHQVVDWPDFEFDAGGVAIAMDAAAPTDRRVLAAGADPRRIGYALGR
jgi:gamma-glutamyltranspeptidase/glutathione hydrolase